MLQRKDTFNLFKCLKKYCYVINPQDEMVYQQLLKKYEIKMAGISYKSEVI